MEDQRLTYTVEEAAMLLGISKAHAYNLLAVGSFPIPVIRAGARILVPKAELLKATGVVPSPKDSPVTA